MLVSEAHVALPAPVTHTTGSVAGAPSRAPADAPDADDGAAVRPTFEELFAAYQAPIQRYVRRLTGDAELARDLTQETFLRVYQALPHLRPDHVRGWVYRIATNVCLDELRRRALIRWESLEGLPGGAGGLGDALASAPALAPLRPGGRAGGATLRSGGLRVAGGVGLGADPEGSVLRAECAREVRAVLGRLSPRHREALVLSGWHGLSRDEIGRALGLSPSAVKALLLRARAQFRREWARAHGPTPSASPETTAAGASA